MQDHKATVLENEHLSGPLYLMRLQSGAIANQIEPGQFVHMTIPTLQANILRRPFSIYDADADSGIVDVLYQIVGVGTEAMTKWEKGQETSMIGPIGRPWSLPVGCRRAILVGGGVGAAPLLLLYKQLISSGVDVDVILGAANRDALVCKERYDSFGLDRIFCTTDDGSFGTCGFATVELEAELAKRGAQDPYDYAAICGPEPLMRAACAMTLEAGIPTQVSMERRMACGVGACLSCVVETKGGRRRACVDGPIFDASEVVWQ